MASQNKHLWLTQLWALLWKSWIIRKVHFISTFFEVLCPVIIIFLVAYSNSNANPTTSNNDNKNVTLDPVYYDKIQWQVTYDFDEDVLRYVYQSLKLFYTPDNDVTKQLVSAFRESNANTETKVDLTPCDNETELDHKLSQITGNGVYTGYTAGFVFYNADEENVKKGSISYKIKILGYSQNVALVQQMFPIKLDQAPEGYAIQAQFYNPFTKYQQYLNREYIKLVCKLNEAKNCDEYLLPVDVFRMAYPRYQNPKTMLVSVYDFIGLTVIFSYVVFVPLVVKRITDEKSSKSRELLRLIGMSDGMYWTSHFLNNFIVIFVHAIVFTMIFKWYGANPMIDNASGLVVFLGLLLFGIQLILFSMTITTVFNRPVIATIVTTVLWITLGAIFAVLLSPSFNLDKTKDSMALNGWRRLTCLTPAGSIIFFMTQLGQYENYGLKLDFDNLNFESILFGSFTVLQTLLLMLGSIPIYCFFIWYIDNVWPFQDGVPKKPWYLFQPSYWFPERDAEKRSEFRNWDKNVDTDSKLFEPINSNDEPIISVSNVTKKFTSGFGNTKTAVNNLSLNIYPHQITVLLGHNGAGKSTTMNMITGMFSPSSGLVSVNGFDVSTQTKLARKSLSLCPQENIIFTELTVSQHLWLFAMLKGSPAGMIDQEIVNVLKLLKLLDKRHEKAMNLSGGMKRKLSLGIALVGDTNTLILDEPTSGMDPDARRVIWDLLLTIRRQKTILITTHYMEEADVLADRIAIMNDGKLSCSGSPYFLKNALGTGYRLRIAKIQGFESERFLKVVRRYIPSAHLMSEVETEVVISLESDLNKNDLMVKLMHLFQDIEKNRNALKVDSSGLSYSTLEDVFLTVGSDLKWNGLNDDRLENERLELSRSNELNSGFSLVMVQLGALLLKRFNYSRRYWVMFLFQLVIPAIIIFIAVGTQNSLLATFKGASTASLTANTLKLYGSDSKSFYFGEDLLKKSYEGIIKDREKGSIFFSEKETEKRALDDAVLKDVNNNLYNYIHHYLYGLGVNGSRYSIYINYEQYHSPPLIFNVLFESILQTILKAPSTLSVNVVNQPVVIQREQDNQDYLAVILPWVFTSLIFLPIAFPFLSSSYIMFAIEENVSKSKLIQLMTKMSPAVFWLANYLFDLVCHLIAVLFLFLIIFLFDNQHVIFGETANNAGK